MNKVFVILLSMAVPLLSLACSGDETGVAPMPNDELQHLDPRVTVTEAKSLVDSGRAVLVDTRSSEQFAERRAKGAILAPLEVITVNPDTPALSGIPEDQAMILYCT